MLVGNYFPPREDLGSRTLVLVSWEEFPFLMPNAAFFQIQWEDSDQRRKSSIKFVRLIEESNHDVLGGFGPCSNNGYLRITTTFVLCLLRPFSFSREKKMFYLKNPLSILYKSGHLSIFFSSLLHRGTCDASRHRETHRSWSNYCFLSCQGTFSSFDRCFSYTSIALYEN